jgi:hypothetical protein
VPSGKDVIVTFEGAKATPEGADPSLLVPPSDVAPPSSPGLDPPASGWPELHDPGAASPGESVADEELQPVAPAVARIKNSGTIRVTRFIRRLLFVHRTGRRDLLRPVAL